MIVNRYWALLFGRGLVATPADFGSQGQLPTHPALLDWLATTFVAVGMGSEGAAEAASCCRRPTGSRRSPTPRRASAIRPNEWLARGPSYRLSAEQVRDAALAASGLLVATIGGPSVYPYQPAGLWEALATRNATTYTKSARATTCIGAASTRCGSARRRRRRRSASTRPSACSARSSRQRTSTPLQALVLLNDPQFVEAARALAERA